MSGTEDIETLLGIGTDERVLESVIATKIDMGMIMEMMPKHFHDPIFRPPGYAVGSAFRRGLLVLTNKRLIFAAHPGKKRPDGLLRNIDSDISLAWNRFVLRVDENHTLELVVSIGLSSILAQRVVHDGIELITGEPEPMAIYFRDFVVYSDDVPMNQGFPRMISSDRLLRCLTEAKDALESEFEN